MLDDVVIVPVEVSNSDLMIILEVAKRMGMNRNEAIRFLIRKGFESLSSSKKSSKVSKK